MLTKIQIVKIDKTMSFYKINVSSVYFTPSSTARNTFFTFKSSVDLAEMHPYGEPDYGQSTLKRRKVEKVHLVGFKPVTACSVSWHFNYCATTTASSLNYETT